MVQRIHHHKSITFLQRDIVKNVYPIIRSGLRGKEVRLEDKWGVTRISDNACVITWQPRACFFFKKKTQFAVTIKQFLRDYGMIYHASSIHSCVVFENLFSKILTACYRLKKKKPCGISQWTYRRCLGSVCFPSSQQNYMTATVKTNSRMLRAKFLRVCQIIPLHFRY